MTRSQFKQLVKEDFLNGNCWESLSQVYEFYARKFGYKDWNTMSADYPWEI